MKPAMLALADGTVFEGQAYGAEGETVGEVVFNTSMTGYQEILTDPSYRGQIVVMTVPHVGNTGVNAEDVESTAVQAEAIVAREFSPIPAVNTSASRPPRWRGWRVRANCINAPSIRPRSIG